MDTRIAVIGLGIFGREVALSLSDRGYAVLAIDSDSESVGAVTDRVAQALIFDTTDEAALYEAKIDEMAIVVNAIGTQHIQNSILTTALLHQLGVPRIIARATTNLHGRILRQVGASEVVNPEQAMGRKIAYQIAFPGLREVLALAEGVCVAELPVPPSFVGKTLTDIAVRRKYGVTVIGVQRVTAAASKGDGSPPPDPAERAAVRLLDPKRRLILNMSPNRDTLREDDTLVIIGRQEDVTRLSGLS